MMMSDELIETAKYILTVFRQRGAKIATAESCTGGLISAALTSIAGSSDVYDRGFVTYSNAAKQEMIGVPEELLRNHGAVSAEVAMAMAQGALDHSEATVAVSVTGIAGPGGGSEEKPVGLVYVAVAGPMGLFVEELRLGEQSEALDRNQIRTQSAQIALEMLVAFGFDDDDIDEDPANSIGGDGFDGAIN